MPNKVCFHETTKATAEPTAAHEFECVCVCVSGLVCVSVSVSVSVASWTSVRQQSIRREIVRMKRKKEETIWRRLKQTFRVEAPCTNEMRINVSVPVLLMAGNSVDGLASGNFTQLKFTVLRKSRCTHSIRSAMAFILCDCLIWRTRWLFRCVNAAAVNFFLAREKKNSYRIKSNAKFYRFFSHATHWMLHRTIFRIE